MIDISGENVVLVGALLLFVAVIAGKVAYRFGAPALLLFLGVGMLFGLNFISFRSVEMTQFVGMIALCIILFTGGMDTKFSEIKPIIGPGVVLATVGGGHDGVHTGLVRVAGGSVAGDRDAVRTGAAARLHDVLDRLGVGFLDPAKQEAGVEAEPAAPAGAGERLERPDGLYDDHSAHQRGVAQFWQRGDGHERGVLRRADDRRRPVGVPDRPSGRLDDQPHQPRQPFALLGAAAGVHLFLVRLHRPDQGQRLSGRLPFGSGRRKLQVRSRNVR